MTYNGKDIDRYKATQMQRAQERQIRADKRAFLVAKESGQKDAEKAAAAKLAASRAKMKDFLSQTGLQQYQLRESVPGWPQRSGQRSRAGTKMSVLDFLKRPCYNSGQNKGGFTL